jgi:hypothetical protein
LTQFVKLEEPLANDANVFVILVFIEGVDNENSCPEYHAVLGKLLERFEYQGIELSSKTFSLNFDSSERVVLFVDALIYILLKGRNGAGESAGHGWKEEIRLGSSRPLEK